MVAWLGWEKLECWIVFGIFFWGSSTLEAPPCLCQHDWLSVLKFQQVLNNVGLSYANSNKMAKGNIWYSEKIYCARLNKHSENLHLLISHCTIWEEQKPAGECTSHSWESMINALVRWTRKALGMKHMSWCQIFEKLSSEERGNLFGTCAKNPGLY